MIFNSTLKPLNILYYLLDRWLVYGRIDSVTSIQIFRMNHWNIINCSSILVLASCNWNLIFFHMMLAWPREMCRYLRSFIVSWSWTRFYICWISLLFAFFTIRLNIFSLGLWLRFGSLRFQIECLILWFNSFLFNLLRGVSLLIFPCARVLILVIKA